MFPTQRAWLFIKGQTAWRNLAIVHILWLALLAPQGCAPNSKGDGASNADSGQGPPSNKPWSRIQPPGAGAGVLPPADAPEPEEATLNFYHLIRDHLRSAGASIIEDTLQTSPTFQWVADGQNHRWKRSAITAMHRANDAIFYCSVFETKSGTTRNHWAEIVVVTGDAYDFYLLMEDEDAATLVRRSPRETTTLIQGDAVADAAQPLGIARQPLNENTCIVDRINTDVCKFSVGVLAGPTGKAVCGGFAQMTARASCLALLLDDGSLVGVADDALIPLCMATVGIIADLSCEVATGVLTEEAGTVLCNNGLRCFARMFDSRCECGLPTSCELCESGCGDFVGTLMCSTVNRLSGPLFRSFGGRKQHIISRICATLGTGQQWCRSFLEESCANLMGKYDRGECTKICQQYCAARRQPESCGDGVCTPNVETCLNCPAECGQCCGCVDMDGDGYGEGCGAGADCDDTASGVHHGSTEICGNGIDEDCSGRDLPCACGDGECNAEENSVWCPMDCTEISYCEDLDDDDFGVGTGCSDYRDCDDQNADVYPGAEELCDGVDNNCNRHVDEGLWLSCPDGANGVENHAVCNQSDWSVCLATEKSTDSCD